MTENELTALARRHADRAIEVLAGIIESETASEDVRAHAAIELFDLASRAPPRPQPAAGDEFPLIGPAIIKRLLN